MDKVIMYVHGKGGHYTEVNQYKKNCTGFDMIGVDYEDDFPWIVEKQIKQTYEQLKIQYDQIYILANSIGAYFVMHTLQNERIEKALFISPILDMERLILDMMSWSNVSEEELCLKKEIPTQFHETLSWEYLTFVRNHPIHWIIPTYILYGDQDTMISRQTIDEFIKTHDAHLTVMENGEHFFHTDEQMMFLNEWMKRSL